MTLTFFIKSILFINLVLSPAWFWNDRTVCASLICLVMYFRFFSSTCATESGLSSLSNNTHLPMLCHSSIDLLFLVETSNSSRHTSIPQILDRSCCRIVHAWSWWLDIGTGCLLFYLDKTTPYRIRLDLQSHYPWPPLHCTLLLSHLLLIGCWLTV